MKDRQEAENLVACDNASAIEFGEFLCRQEGFGAFPNPKKAMEKTIIWLVDNHRKIQDSICRDNRVHKYYMGKFNNQDAIETVTTVLIDTGMFQGIPVSCIANMVVKRGIKEYCNEV